MQFQQIFKFELSNICIIYFQTLPLERTLNELLKFITIISLVSLEASFSNSVRRSSSLRQRM